MWSALIAIAAALHFCLVQSHGTTHEAFLLTNTTVGLVEGFVDPETPLVSRWLGVPYAEPPVASLRFLPPIAKAHQGFISAKTQPKSCPQWSSKLPSIYNNLVQQFNPSPPFGEDCLYLNIFAPSHPRSELLPVLVWIHGGEATYGGIDTPYERPEKWVQASQQHIVVQVNYRLNILGFPNARGLNVTTANPAVLDIRLALEWVRDNIASFHGDQQNILLWGQSAGGALADLYQYAFPKDVITAGTICESGTAYLARTTADVNKTSFSWVAQKLGCGGLSASDELRCMQNANIIEIEQLLQEHSDSDASPPLYFSASADGQTVFTPQQYVEKAQRGDAAPIPMLVGSNQDEGSSFVPFSINGSATNMTANHAATLAVVQCHVAETCDNRYAGGLTTFRYFYGGNFSNISPAPWVGAYHFSELPLIMGTHSDFRTESTPFEYAVSRTMQELWLAFAKSQRSGVQALGWYPYATNGTVQALAVDNVLRTNVSAVTLDAGCAALVK